jgi:hypothetical protein
MYMGGIRIGDGPASARSGQSAQAGDPTKLLPIQKEHLNIWINLMRIKGKRKRRKNILNRHGTLQRHNTENSKQIFPGKGQHGYSPNSYIHVLCERFIYSSDPSAYSAAGK